MEPPTLGSPSCCSGTLKCSMPELVLGGSQSVEKRSGLVTALDPLPTPWVTAERQLSHLNPVSRNEDKNALCQMKNIFLIRFHFGGCVCAHACVHACVHEYVCVCVCVWPSTHGFTSVSSHTHACRGLLQCCCQCCQPGV